MSTIPQYNWKNFNKKIRFLKKTIRASQLIATAHWETLTQWRLKAFCEF